MKLATVTSTTFKTTIARDGIVVLVYWAGWCRSCEAFVPVLESVAEVNPDIFFGGINTVEEGDLAAVQYIQATPTLVVYRDGILVFEQAGSLPKASVQKLIKKVKVLDMNNMGGLVRRGLLG